MRLIKTLKKKWGNKSNAAFPQENGVTYIHHAPSRGNIGDFLCSPRHYFTFHTPLQGLHIVGGGVFVGLAVDKLMRHNIPCDNAILWGAGQSLRSPEPLGEPVADLPYLDWAIRDRASVLSDERFVPCCSCLHAMLDVAPQSDRTLLFLNADPKVTAEDNMRWTQNFAQKNGWDLLFNNCSEQTFTAALHNSQRIITNSYHGSYWGLLSGRKVTVLGYSSKFIHLLNNVDLPADRMIKIDRGDSDSLQRQLASITDGDGLVLDHAAAILADCRQRNLAFADQLVAQHIFSEYTLKQRVSESCRP
nr:hypothetical protein [uncultured Desulfuromonas sp.]